MSANIEMMSKQAVAWTEDLIAMPSVSGTTQEDSAFQEVIRRIRAIPGATIKVAADEKSALCVSNADMSNGVVAFVGHLDTVPTMSLEAWETGPFSPDVRQGRLYGRGSSDMKSGLAAALVVFERACKESKPCAVVITKDEEIGCLGAPSAVKLFEGLPIAGMVIMESTDNIIRFGHRGALWITATSCGKAAHGSRPELGVNAILRMARAIPHIERMPLLMDERLGKESCNIGTIRGGAVANIVPDRCSVELDIRLAHNHSDEILEYLDAIDTVDDAQIKLNLAPVWTDPENLWVASLQGARDTQPVSYFTEASIFNAALKDVPIIICGPGDPSCVHSVNESVAVDAIGQAVGQFWSYLA